MIETVVMLRVDEMPRWSVTTNVTLHCTIPDAPVRSMSYDEPPPAVIVGCSPVRVVGELPGHCRFHV